MVVHLTFDSRARVVTSVFDPRPRYTNTYITLSWAYRQSPGVFSYSHGQSRCLAC